MIRLILAAALLASVTGCAPDLAALAQDPNALCVRATWIYGSVELNRNHGCDANAALAAVSK